MGALWKMDLVRFGLVDAGVFPHASFLLFCRDTQVSNYLYPPISIYFYVYSIELFLSCYIMHISWLVSRWVADVLVGLLIRGTLRIYHTHGYPFEDAWAWNMGENSLPRDSLLGCGFDFAHHFRGKGFH